MRISLFIACLHVLLFVLLSMRVVLYRFRKRIGIGEGADRELHKRIRVHANFAEYVPLALLLLMLLEAAGVGECWIWGYGLTLLVARVLHALGLGRSSATSLPRFLGALTTFVLLLAMALHGLLHWHGIGWAGA
ncbi:MAPEG family protein [Pseudoxanthomonas kalamensis]|uniref:MAPEG family protein n=1 Tax=Pseudoxanthomonas kalamensis TaxID=289483 RepID=UPI0013919BA0|nr:MAPEG family protein [Pseudoxanthomonas kalamensis]